MNENKLATIDACGIQGSIACNYPRNMSSFCLQETIVRESIKNSKRFAVLVAHEKNYDRQHILFS